MDFLDNNHRIFSLPSFDEKPIGYQYSNQPYIFWVDTNSQTYLSVDNYYIKTIYCVLNLSEYGLTEALSSYYANIEKKQLDLGYDIGYIDVNRTEKTLVDYWLNNDAHPAIDVISTRNSTFNMSINDFIKNKFEIEIELESNIYSLLNAEFIQNQINSISDINDIVKLVDENFELSKTQKLSSNNDNNEIITIVSFEDNEDYEQEYTQTLNAIHEINEQLDLSNDTALSNKKRVLTSYLNTLQKGWYYAVVPIYVLCKSYDEGAWTSNILIHVKNTTENNVVYEKWCPITIGGEFQNMYEELVVNGKNMGVTLPRDILKAIYQESYTDNEFNEELYNEKLKEYLINFMRIKGNQGNSDSIINSLHWFGWGDKLSIKSLFDAQNAAHQSYLITPFNAFEESFLYSYQDFIRTSFIKLYCNINTELLDDNGDIIYYPQNTNNAFYGENNPQLEELGNKYLFVDNYKGIDNVELDNIKYIKKYYDFTFNELSLKLLLVKYYMNKYFLPVHMTIKHAALQYKVYANDVKYTNYVNYNIQGGVISTEDTNVKVTFNKEHTYVFHKQSRIVDEHLNEFDTIYHENDNGYFLQENCISIPITFHNKIDSKGNEQSTYFNCVLLLESENEVQDTFKYVYHTHLNNTVSIVDLINVTDSIALVDNDTNKIYYDIDDPNMFVFGYNANIEDKYNINNIHVYYDKYDIIQNKILSNTTYQHVLNSISLNESIFVTSFINVNDVNNIPTNNINIFNKLQDKTLSYGTTIKINNIDYIFGFLNTYVWDPENNKPYVDIYNPILCILCPENNTKSIIDLTPYLNDENLSMIDRFIYSDNNSKDGNDNLFKYYILYIHGYSDAIDPINVGSRNLQISIIPRYVISIKSNIQNLSLYTYKQKDVDMYLNDNEFLGKINVLHHSIDNRKKSILRYIIDRKINTTEYNLVRKETTKFNLLYESHFSFIQVPKIDNNISNYKVYKNFVLCPKIMGYESVQYYIHNNFILKLLVNNKWYYYKFNTTMSDVSLDLGELVYQYWDDDNMYSSNFAQLQYFDPANKKMLFNAYMHENRLVQVNNINYTKDVLRMYDHENRIYLDMNEIPNDLVIYYINYAVNDVNIKIYISSNVYYAKSSIRIPKINEIFENSDLFKYKELILSHDNKCIVKIEDNIWKMNDILLDDNNGESSNSIILDRHGFEYIERDHPNNVYPIYTSINNINVLSKYSSKFNIPNDKQYLNQVILFDLKKNVLKEHDVLRLSDKLHMSLNGIMFDRYTSTNKIYISGRLFRRPDELLTSDDILEYKEICNGESENSYMSDISDHVDIYSVISNIKSTPRELEDPSLFESMQLYVTGRDKYHSGDKNTVYYRYYITSDLEYVTIPYTSVEHELGYNIYTSRESIENMFVKTNVFKKFECIYNDGTTTELKTYYYITLVDTDNKFKIFVKLSENSAQTYELKISYQYNTINNTFVVNYNYIELNKNVPVYITSPEDIAKVHKDANDKYIYKNVNNITTHDNTHSIEVEQVIVENSIDTLNDYPIGHDPSMVWFNGKILLDQQTKEKLNNNLEELIGLYNQSLINNNMLTVWSNLNVNDQYQVENIFGDVLNKTLSAEGDEFEQYAKDFKEYVDKFNEVTYYNPLEIDVTGFVSNKYKLKLQYTTNIEDNKIEIILKVKTVNSKNIECEYILHKDDIVTPDYLIIHDGNHARTISFDINNEKIISVNLYFQLHHNLLIDDNGKPIDLSDKEYWIDPKLIAEYYAYESIPYKSDNINYDMLNIIDNINSTNNKWESLNICDQDIKDSTIDLYDKFFTCKYKLFDVTNKTVYDVIDDNYNGSNVPTYEFIDNINETFIKTVNDELHNNVWTEDVQKAELLSKEGITWTFEKHVVESKPWCTLNINNMDYDLYLMHDLEKWYVIYISRQTLGHVLRKSDEYINIEDFNDTGNLTMISDDGEYKLEYKTYNNQFLINRYKFISSKGNNIFNKSSIIAGVLSNNRLGVNLDISSKWNISRPTLNKTISPSVESNQEMTIISSVDNEYKNGYYNVNVRYALDGITNNQYIKKCIMKIE